MGINIDIRAVEIKKALDKIEKNIKEIVTKAATTENPTNLFWSQLQRDVKKEYEKLRVVGLRWSSENIPQTYIETIREQVKRIKNIKFRPPINTNFTTIKKRQINKTSISSLLQDFNNTWLLRMNESERFVLRTFNLTQQQLLKDKAIDKAIERGFFRTGSTYGAQKELQKEFMGKLLDDKFITVIDKNGKDIHYQIKTYSEMLARTNLSEASTTAVINTGVEFGTDLVQVSAHNTETPFDAQFEGKIYSISGNDPDFPKASFLPPFHPNCIHTISVVFRETLERRGIKKYIDFSDGTSEVHPTRKSHVPISQRFPKDIASNIKTNKIKG